MWHLWNALWGLWGRSYEKLKCAEWHKWFKEGWMLKSQMKTMLITYFDIKVTVHFEFIPLGQTVNHAYYMEILKWLHEAAHKGKAWTLVQWLDYPAWQCSSSQGAVMQFLSQNQITEMEQPTYSLDLALSDF
jgi:hypothetical protein